GVDVSQVQRVNSNPLTHQVTVPVSALPEGHLPAAGKGGRIFGAPGTVAIGAIAFGTTLLPTGSFAKAAEATANGPPGPREAMAVAKGHYTEAFIRGTEEIPLVGTLTGFVTRPLAQMAGAQVENSLLQDASQAGSTNLARQAALTKEIGTLNAKLRSLYQN